MTGSGKPRHTSVWTLFGSAHESQLAKGRKGRVRSLLLLFGGTYIDRRSSGKSRVMAFSVALGVATNKIAPDDLRRNGPFTYSITYPRQPRTYPKLSCCPPIECEKASQREYSRSTDEEIVISRAYAGAHFSEHLPQRMTMSRTRPRER